MGDARGVVAIGSVYDRAEDYAALVDAFAHLRPGSGAPQFPEPAYGERALRPRAAALGKTRLVPLKKAAGEIAARAVGAYPPGCATAAPGERLTRGCVEFLLASRAAGGDAVRGRGRSGRSGGRAGAVRECGAFAHQNDVFIRRRAIHRRKNGETRRMVALHSLFRQIWDTKTGNVAPFP